MNDIDPTSPATHAATAEHILENRRLWDQMAPVELVGVDAVELGCGTGYVSAWLARRGAGTGRRHR